MDKKLLKICIYSRCGTARIYTTEWEQSKRQFPLGNITRHTFPAIGDCKDGNYDDIEITLGRGDRYKINYNNLSDRIIINEGMSITCSMLEDKSKIALYQYMEKIIDFTLKAAKGG